MIHFAFVDSHQRPIASLEPRDQHTPDQTKSAQRVTEHGSTLGLLIIFLQIDPSQPTYSPPCTTFNMPKVHLLDYVAGNIRSLVNAIEKCGYEVEWIRSPEDVQKADVRSLPSSGRESPELGPLYCRFSGFGLKDIAMPLGRRVVLSVVELFMSQSLDSCRFFSQCLHSPSSCCYPR